MLNGRDAGMILNFSSSLLSQSLRRPNLLAHEDRVGDGEAHQGDGDQRDEVGVNNIDTLGEGKRTLESGNR